MAPEADPLELLGLEPHESLLEADRRQLPASVGEPESLPPSPVRRQLVGLGATLTGVTLIAGLALIVLGLVEAVTGGSAVLTAGAFVIGIVLAATHWGWVHVAELSANRLEGRRNAALLDRRRTWLRGIEAHPRWEVTTAVGGDGSITMVTTCYRPVVRSPGTYTFVREEVARETHSGEEPAAEVAERAELLRRQAAAQTGQARERFEAARDAYEQALMVRDDEEQRLAALRAASEALSERINSHLKDPPVTE
jgi:hypothetical protein